MRLSLLALGALLAAAPAVAQPLTATQPVAVYRYAEPGQPTMEVSVWGAVRIPGRYQVQPDTDLLELMSFAGGPVLQPDRSDADQRVIVTVTRQEGGQRSVLLEKTVPELTSSPEALPALQQGDIVTVNAEIKNRLQLRDFAVFTSTLASLTLVVLRLVDGR